VRIASTHIGGSEVSRLFGRWSGRPLTDPLIARPHGCRILGSSALLIWLRNRSAGRLRDIREYPPPSLMRHRPRPALVPRTGVDPDGSRRQARVIPGMGRPLRGAFDGEIVINARSACRRTAQPCCGPGNGVRAITGEIVRSRRCGPRSIITRSEHARHRPLQALMWVIEAL
jgi:hypothetical protein